jgi:hypothetical protein
MISQHDEVLAYADAVLAGDVLACRLVRRLAPATAVIGS